MNWETIKIILLCLGGLVLLIGIIRVLTTPYRGFWSMLSDLFLIDWLGNLLGGIADIISDIDFDTD